MIDTHSHLLPGIDDGSPHMDATLTMAEAAVTAGVTTVVCTPHLRELDLSLVEEAREVLGKTRTALSVAGLSLQLLLGFEVDVSVAAVATDKELALLTVEGSQGALLVEMPHWGWPIHLHDTIFRLRTAGFTPILAHPERNDRIQSSPELLTECVAAGAVPQATAASLEGGFGRGAKAAFLRHLARGEYGLLATDAHWNRRSSWTIESVVSRLQRDLTADNVEILTQVNPRRVLAGQPLLAVAPARSSGWRRSRSRTWL